MRRVLRVEKVQGLLRRLGRRLYCSFDRFLYVRVLSGPTDESRAVPHLSVRRFAGLTEELKAVYGTFTDDTSFARRFKGNVFCDVAFADGDPAALLWASLDPCEEPSLNALLRLAPKDAYVMELYTRPPYRRREIARFLLNSLCRELSARGSERLFLLTRAGNLPMIRLAEAAGYVRYHRISTRRLAPLERLTAAPFRPVYAGGLLVRAAGAGMLPFRRHRWIITLTRSRQPDPSDRRLP